MSMVPSGWEGVRDKDEGCSDEGFALHLSMGPAWEGSWVFSAMLKSVVKIVKVKKLSERKCRLLEHISMFKRTKATRR